MVKTVLVQPQVLTKSGRLPAFFLNAAGKGADSEVHSFSHAGINEGCYTAFRGKKEGEVLLFLQESTVLVDYCACHFSVDVDDFREVS